MFCSIPFPYTTLFRSTVVGGLLATVSTRSGPLTVTCVAEALQLLLSFVSGTTRVSSAQASRKDGQRVVQGLSVAVSVRLEVAQEGSSCTAGTPMSRRSAQCD